MPDYTIAEWLDMVDNMKERCRTSNDRLIDIFNDVCRSNPEVSSSYSYQSVSAILSRERAKYRPRIPDTLLELSEILNSDKVIKVHLKAGESSVLIFTTEKLLSGFAESNEFFMDGTFSNNCRQPRVNQIYTIHFKYKTQYHAGLIVLTENRVTDTYKTIFQWLIDNVKDSNNVNVLKTKKITIITDFEKSTIKALRACFPNAKIHGCHFHFSQAVIKRWQKLNIQVSNSVLSMYLSVPLLPSKCFKEAEKCLEEERDKVVDIDVKILQFHNYYTKTWLKDPEHVSVFNLSTRSTGGPESFHRHNRNKLGGEHPNASKLTDGIEKIVEDEEINYTRLEKGLKTKKHTPQYLINRTNYIQRTQQDLECGLTVKEFLKMFPKSFEELQYTIKKLINDCNLHEIPNDPDPSSLDVASAEEERSSEKTLSVHKSLKHLENITNKIHANLKTGKATVDVWLKKKKKRGGGKIKKTKKQANKQVSAATSNLLELSTKNVCKLKSHSKSTVKQKSTLKSTF